MKNKIILLIFSVLLLPIFVNAESCKVISGNGKDPGSEIQCGTEQFYLVQNKNDKLKLLAKYNLMVGDKIDYFEFDTPQLLSDPNYDCMEEAQNRGYDPYYVFPIVADPNGNTNVIKGCRVYELIEYDRVLQDERAIGTKLVDGKSVLPLYGITYMDPAWGYDALVEHEYYYNDYDRRGNLIVEDTKFEEYLDGYKSELERQGINVEKVSFSTLNTILDLLEEVSGNDIIVDLEYDPDATEWPDYYTGKMDIKEFTGEKHKWIHGTTYWLGSGFYGDGVSAPDGQNDYYISNEGLLCAIGRGECSYLAYPIGNGVRPLVTVNAENVLFKIQTITDGNGTIEVVDRAVGNDTIQFRVTSKKGYKLSSLIIHSDSGETVIFNEGSIVNNPDGTVSIDRNVFTMPFENVTIEARWSITNPYTSRGNLIYIAIGVLLTALAGVLYFMKQKSLD